MKVRNKQVYVAADGSEHDTLDGAVQSDVANFLTQVLRSAPCPSGDTAEDVVLIMAHWSTLVTLIDRLNAQVVPVEETPQDRLDADFEDENDATEALRGDAHNRRVQDHQRDDNYKGKCVDCGSKFFHRPGCRYYPRG